MSPIDLFISSGEPSGDLQGSLLIEALLKERSSIRIGAVAGPRMRRLPIEPYFEMEQLSVMGFIDVIAAIPHLIRQFFQIRNKILELNPKAVVCIDYPGFHLRLEKSLRKKGYRGKLIHYISPTVWAWGKKRIPQMEKTLDLLLTIFPFEKKCFSNTFPVQYVGHPLIGSNLFPNNFLERKKILAIFPGSREKEIERNLPLQLKTAENLALLDPSLRIAVSISHPNREKQIRSLCPLPVHFYSPEENYDLMRSCHVAIATSGTVTLELALHQTPTVVTYGISPLDVWLAQKIFKINLPSYCIVNIIASKRVFPELFGPELSQDRLFKLTKILWLDESVRKKCLEECSEIINTLGRKQPSREAALAILEKIGE